MGMESYFLNLKLTEGCPKHFEAICEQMLAEGFSIAAKRSGRFWKKTAVNCAVVEKLVVMDYKVGNRTVSLEACFSCFEKSKTCMAEIASFFYKYKWADYGFYGNQRLPGEEFCNLTGWIDAKTAENHRIFVEKYSEKQIDLLPNEDFYRKRRKYYKE